MSGYYPTVKKTSVVKLSCSFIKCRKGCFGRSYDVTALYKSVYYYYNNN